MTDLPAHRQLPASLYEVDKALVNSLPAPVKFVLHARYANNFEDFVGYRWDDADYLPVPTCDDIAAALALVEAMLKPSSPAVVKRELAWLRATTISREVAPEDWRLRLPAYAEELMRYPEEIMVAAVRHCGRTNRYWPALADLISECDRLSQKRRSLRMALLYPPRRTE